MPEISASTIRICIKLFRKMIVHVEDENCERDLRALRSALLELRAAAVNKKQEEPEEEEPEEEEQEEEEEDASKTG